MGGIINKKATFHNVRHLTFSNSSIQVTMVKIVVSHQGTRLVQVNFLYTFAQNLIIAQVPC